MYKILTVDDRIRVAPSKFDRDVEEAIKASLEERWEGIIDKKLGVVLSIVKINNMGEGRILPGDGAIFYPVEFEVLSYYPEVHELVKGNVIDVTEFGVFARIGPLDGMIHVSQLMNDFVSYDPKNAVFVGRESKNIVKEADDVVARVISVSLSSRQYKIGLTTRQQGLGAMAWIEKEKSGEKPVKGAAPKGKPAKPEEKEKTKPEEKEKAARPEEKEKEKKK